MKATHNPTPSADSAPGALLNWTKTGSAGKPAPCVICRRPAICRNPEGKPCHKTCAEAQIAAHTTTAPEGVDILAGAA
ncbi:MAG TPA: hypothetical protein VGD43_14785 [Micromonospora sp.]